METQLSLFDRQYLERGREAARRLYPVLGTCEDCGEQPATDRHHKSGDTHDNRRANIALLCRRCHMLADGRLEALRTAPRPRPTHCKRGHEFDEANTRWMPDGRRICRKCHAIRAAAHKIRKRDERRQQPGRWFGDRWWTDDAYEELKASVHRRRCPHQHRTREAREACERRLNL